MLLFALVFLLPALLLGVVRPGFRGSVTVAGAVLGIRTGSVRETVDNIVTNNTTSTLDASNLLPETRVQSAKRCRLNMSAQYSAGGAGDPPNFAGTLLYGDIAVVAVFGDTISGNFQTEELGNNIDVIGDINYDLAMASNGTYTRTRGT